MTIKKRIFLFNILMIVIPLILRISIILIMRIVVINHIGFDKSKDQDDDRFYIIINEIKNKFKNWNGDSDIVFSTLNDLQKKYETENVLFSLYKDKTNIFFNESKIYSYIENTVITNFLLQQKGNHVVIIDNLALFTYQLDDYTIVLIDTAYSYIDLFAYRAYLTSVVLVYLILSFVIILLINIILTRNMWNRITKSLNILTHGVHQIRDDNLKYRIHYAQKDEFFVVCGDFNEMAQRLEDVVEARKKDAQSRKELIAGISHDLRTPLTSIKAYVEGIEKGVASTPDIQKKYLNIIKNKTNDLEHIIHQLFIFSKLDVEEFPLHFELIEISSVISHMIDDFSEEYQKKGLTIEYEDNQEAVYINVDVILLRNVFINIFENTCKYKIKESACANVWCKKENDYLCIYIADDGPGVNEEQLPQLFDVFYRGDPSRNTKGSGLGLAITSKIINQMNGIIYAQNIKQGGLMIVIKFPLIVHKTHKMPKT